MDRRAGHEEGERMEARENIGHRIVECRLEFGDSFFVIEANYIRWQEKSRRSYKLNAEHPVSGGDI